ncbi:MAG TPA: PIN domain-containing protein [Acidobacteriota bacterium]|nr:PIN domain-containing protein [Acidobacteriota bacterium]
MRLVADTGPLYALADAGDPEHEATRKFLESRPQTLIVPSPVVPEVCYLLHKHLGEKAERLFQASLLNEELILENPSRQDLARVLEILEQYSDAGFGFVDATVMAMAERLKTDSVLTLDHRHFSIFRPRHCEALHLYP